MQALASFLCGMIFGSGLMISGMTQPAKVLGFLDIFGRWDPTLAFVMAGALAISSLGYALARRQIRPVIAAQHFWPKRTDIDRSLVVGSMLFGIGWGLAGLCPGPAGACHRPSRFRMPHWQTRTGRLKSPDDVRIVQHRSQCFRLARHFGFSNDPARIIHNADARLLDRNI